MKQIQTYRLEKHFFFSRVNKRQISNVFRSHIHLAVCTHIYEGKSLLNDVLTLKAVKKIIKFFFRFSCTTTVHEKKKRIELFVYTKGKDFYTGIWKNTKKNRQRISHREDITTIRKITKGGFFCCLWWQIFSSFIFFVLCKSCVCLLYEQTQRLMAWNQSLIVSCWIYMYMDIVVSLRYIKLYHSRSPTQLDILYFFL